MYTIYLLESWLNDVKIYKIGYTKRDVNKRIKELKTGNANTISLIKKFETNKYVSNIEKMLHFNFSHKKYTHEWFILDDNDVKDFDGLCIKYFNMYDNISKCNTYLLDKKISIK